MFIAISQVSTPEPVIQSKNITYLIPWVLGFDPQFSTVLYCLESVKFMAI